MQTASIDINALLVFTSIDFKILCHLEMIYVGVKHVFACTGGSFYNACHSIKYIDLLSTKCSLSIKPTNQTTKL